MHNKKVIFVLQRLFIIGLLFFAIQSWAATRYVSTDGKDIWSGTLSSPSPDGTDGPLASLAGARDAIRKLKAASPLVEPVTVLIADGVYALEEPVAFTPEDSGTATCPITYMAAPDSKPVFSGGRVISGWTKGEGTIWKVRVPEVSEGSLYFHQLFVDGRRATRARTPNVGYLRTDGPIKPLGNRDEARRDPSTKIGFRFVPGDIVHWPNLEEVNVFAYHSWTSSLHWIQEIDDKENIVRFLAGSAWPMSWWEKNERYHIENYREALDSPGEWYLDPKTGICYYWPLEGEDMSNVHVVAPKLGLLLRADWDKDSENCVEHITFKGLSFQHADWLMEKTAVNDGQGAAFQNDATVMLTGARNITFEECEIAHTGTYALWFRQGSQNNQVKQCHLHDLGTGGIRIGETSTPENIACAVEHILVDNSWIHDGGHVFPAGHGVWIGRASYNTISHCDISDFYYTGIAIGWSWGYAESTAHHNVVEYCHIHNLGKGVLSDMGTIYTLGLAPGTRLCNNVMHDVYSYAYGGWGLYNDEGSTGIVMENNIVYNTKTGGYHQHYGKENILRNNILAFSKEGQVIRSREEDHISFILERNIILTDNGMPLGKSWRNGNYKMDYNLYWDVTTGSDLDFADWTFKEWQKRGYDIHSVIADPLFEDSANYDLRLKPGSPAYELGFKDIDTSKVGLYGEPEWSGLPETIERASVDTSLAKPPSTQVGLAEINENFEADVPDEAPRNGSCSIGDAAHLTVTDETAAVGKHSLKFVDAEGLENSWQPHLNYQLNVRSGTVKNGFYLRAAPGAHFTVEWRDWRTSPYKVGPTLTITPLGELQAAGKPVTTIPQSQWVKLELNFAVGSSAPKTFELHITLKDQATQTFDGLPFGNDAFQRLTWFGVSSMATDKQTFYIDDIVLESVQ